MDASYFDLSLNCIVLLATAFASDILDYRFSICIIIAIMVDVSRNIGLSSDRRCLYTKRRN